MYQADERDHDRMVRVSRLNPCPVCGKSDWCLVAADQTVCICPRIESTRRAGDAGYLHVLVERKPGASGGVRRVAIPMIVPPTDLTALAGRYRRAVSPRRLNDLAASLDLSAESLTALGIGWSAAHGAWSLPMSDPATGIVVGIRLRKPNGTKFAVRGGKDGLFLPVTGQVAGEPLLVTEGPTDTAALLDLGFLNVAGRPSCSGGVRHLVSLVRTRRTAEVVIVADADEPGRRGAAHLASILRVYCPVVRVIEPPPGVKDVRAWKQAGATRADVERLIEAAPDRRLIITTAIRGRQ
jgi:hypothetical protein